MAMSKITKQRAVTKCKVDVYLPGGFQWNFLNEKILELQNNFNIE